ncbi:putative cupin domain-containing protein [Golovinomyces cichoracearum]|uniref:Putative cupin domain-containing protein n=1 Tax=Golovinomyces cichoracearum TaxID=62708 RepID=A0A420IQK3_9PEZI|nr:putative cupin domain-containing protein [Golovinomyces cichoracearum]
MAESIQQAPEPDHRRIPKNLPPVHRHITTHSSKGKAIFDDSFSSSACWENVPLDPEIPPMASFFLAYATTGFPIDVNPSVTDNNNNESRNKKREPQDIQNYKQKLSDDPLELIHNNATVLRYVDFRPGAPPFMHQTQSLDYGIVIEGEIELILDSGETRTLKRGDACVQRATMHAWRNTSETEWARMVFVLISSTQPSVLEEDSGTVVSSL